MPSLSSPSTLSSTSQELNGKDACAIHLLDLVDWGSHHHAYGPATDVPAQLRALQSTDKAERDKAYHSLYGNIFHQGDRYEATAYAVPYLLKILENPSTPDRVSVITLLVCLAVGIYEDELPQGINQFEWNESSQKVGEPEDEVDYHMKIDELASQAKDEEPECLASKNQLAAYGAVCAGVPVFQKCLEQQDAGLKSWAAFALAWFPQKAAGENGSSAVLQRVLDRELDPAVRASAMIALGLLNGRFDGAVPQDIDSLVSRLRDYSTDPHTLVQWAAAVALARLGHHEPEHVAVLTRCLTDPSFIPAGFQAWATVPFPFCSGGFFQYSAMILETLNTDDYPDVVPAVLDALLRSQDQDLDAVALTKVALQLAFGPMPDHYDAWPLEQLNELQRRTVTTLAEMGEELWWGKEFPSVLEDWNIPDTSRDDLRRYVGLPIGGSSSG